MRRERGSFFAGVLLVRGSGGLEAGGTVRLGRRSGRTPAGKCRCGVLFDTANYVLVSSGSSGVMPVWRFCWLNCVDACSIVDCFSVVDPPSGRRSGSRSGPRSSHARNIVVGEWPASYSPFVPDADSAGSRSGYPCMRGW